MHCWTMKMFMLFLLLCFPDIFFPSLFQGMNLFHLKDWEVENLLLGNIQQQSVASWVTWTIWLGHFSYRGGLELWTAVLYANVVFMGSIHGGLSTIDMGSLGWQFWDSMPHCSFCMQWLDAFQISRKWHGCLCFDSLASHLHHGHWHTTDKLARLRKALENALQRAQDRI